MRLIICRQFNILDRAVYDRQPYTWILSVWDSMVAENEVSHKEVGKDPKAPILMPGVVEGPWPV